MNKIIIIAAAGENNALGYANDLPWHLPDDFKRFKRLTSGHKIVMGRKTLESFPKALPNREHIVVTRNTNYKPKIESTVVHSIDTAIAMATEDMYVIGGGEIYKQSMHLATHIELTRIHSTFKADTFFPEIDETIWKVTKQEYHPKDDRHPHDFTFISYERIGL